MGTKNKQGGGIVYSTDPTYKPPVEEEIQPDLLPSEQRLRVRLETKHRAGKSATVVIGFIGSEASLNALGKALRNHCGTGGSAKDGEIIVQGDQVEKTIKYLLANGYKDSKRG